MLEVKETKKVNGFVMKLKETQIVTTDKPSERVNKLIFHFDLFLFFLLLLSF